MAIYEDLSGNSPFGAGHVDARGGGHIDLQAIAFRGDSHAITLGAASVQTPVFSTRCRAIRISLEGSGECNFAIGSNPTAVQDGDDMFPAGAIEIIAVRGGIDRLAAIQQAAETDTLIVTEDLS